MILIKNDDTGTYETIDQVTEVEEKCGELKQVFLNGKITNLQTLAEIRGRANG